MSKRKSKPSPAINRLTKEQKEREKDFVKRQKAMEKELKDLSRKYRIDIVGAFEYRRDGIYPLIAFADMKDQYEQVVKDDNLKPKLET